MPSWEYKTIQFDLTRWFLPRIVEEPELVQTLAAADAEGWELVSAVPIGMEGGSTRELILIMRRPRKVASASPHHRATDRS